MAAISHRQYRRTRRGFRPPSQAEDARRLRPALMTRNSWASSGRWKQTASRGPRRANCWWAVTGPWCTRACAATGAASSRRDLMQVGYIGLMRAISHFDPEVGGNLAAYAQVCISGEIKRHFRDKCWPVHVKRSAQDLVMEARKATTQPTRTGPGADPGRDRPVP